MSVREDAKRNLELAGLFDKDSDYSGMVGDAVMKLVNTHCDEGHSGYSQHLTLQLFNKVINGQALTAKYWDEMKVKMDKFSDENMGAPWKPEMIKEMLGERPKQLNREGE